MPRRLLTAAALALLLAPTSPAAQRDASKRQASAPAFPSTPPEPGTPRDFTVPEPKRFTLENGLEVALVQWGTMPKVRVTVAVRSGNAFEGPKEVWLADLTGDMMREGTRTRSSAQISQDAARMGGSLNIAVGPDTTTVFGDVLSEYGGDFVGLVADVLQHPTLPESELARLKGNMLRNLAVASSQPQQIALEKFLAVVYGDHPYGRLFPTEEMIKSYALADVRRFYASTYGAGRSRLYVVGRFDSGAVETAIRKAFAGWERGAPPKPAPARPESGREVHVVDRPGAPQSTIIIGVPTIDPSSDDYIPMTVMDAILGGAFASRITKNIREDKGYTYSPGSEISVRYRDAYWAENADVTTTVTGPSIKEIFAEIDRLQAEPPSKEELRGIQNYVAGTYVLQNSSRAGITAQLAFMDLHGLPASYASTYVKRVHAVTPEQVTEMARRHIADDTATIVVVGDRKVIEEQIKPFGRIVGQ